ncbi:MAG: hypothetical protein AAGG48_17660 [Planctomycetota bacterium]
MNQNEINRAVARATGETVSAIKRLGFLIADPNQPFNDPTDPVHGGRVIDWDDFDLLRREPDDSSLDLEAACY